MSRTNLSLLLVVALVVAACGKGGGAGNAEAGHGEANNGEHAEHAEEGGGIELSREQMIAAGIAIGRAKPVSSGAVIIATGEIQADPDQLVQLGPAVAGRVTMARGAVGERVRMGQALASVVAVEQPAASADLRSAEARLALAREDVAREKSLFDRGLSPKRDLLAAESELRQAEANLEAMRLRTSALASTVSSPISGVIAERRVSVGQIASPGDIFYVIVAPEKLQAVLDVYDNDLPRVRPGSRVTISSEAISDRSFVARVDGLSPMIDEVTRTSKVRAVVENADSFLRPGLFVTASIDAEGPDSDSSTVLMVPENAVCRLGDRRVVFVVTSQEDHGIRFEPRDVEIGHRSGEMIAIREGLAADDLVALQGAFSVLSALRKGELGEGHAH